ncbi:MAG TPA: vWA domain-containing protein [Acidimicrobiales bacterium]|nr:vWA domain-containing protein [Acidimicrobiales bacterium]
MRISPAVGTLDDAAFDEELASDPDVALGLLADMASATDPQLRQLARRLAGRVLVHLARGGPARAGGVGRLRVAPMQDGGDVDFDSSMDALLGAAARRSSPSLTDLRARQWARPTTGLCLLVDRSGSMGGRRLATAALAAAAVAFRAPGDYSVVTFAEEVTLVKGQDEERPVEAVVDDILALRGRGTTNLAAALDEGRAQLSRSRATHRGMLLISDCRANTGADPLLAARAVDRLMILAPAGDSAEARALADAVGGRCVEISGPSSVPAGLAALVGS